MKGGREKGGERERGKVVIPFELGTEVSHRVDMELHRNEGGREREREI